ncbi:MAG: radical SAM protein [Candidatus Firestonebacteria bacterium]
MLRILFMTLFYKLFYYLGFPRLLPFSYTFSVTFKCNSRCRTCGVWQRQGEDLKLDEFKKIFSSLGRSPFWVTISGGEPFLRTDLVDIVKALYDTCLPAVINIPTNGILENIIPERVEELVKYCKKSSIIINVSLDDIREKHDEIRGFKGNFEKAMLTYTKLRKLEYPNLTLGIHTVISKFNVVRIKEIFEELAKLNPDSYITEIAERRGELLTLNSDITPEAEVYRDAVEFLMRETGKKNYKGAGKLTKLIREEYYRLAGRVLAEKKQIIPCYAGVSTAHVAADGNVWFCCMKSETLGSLCEADYDLKKLWFTEKAAAMRKAIKKERCFCPLANMSYTNMLMSPRCLFKLGIKYVFGIFK